MSNVPRHGRTRHSHARGVRSTHGDNGYGYGFTLVEDSFDQTVIDGVPASPVVVVGGTSGTPGISLDFTPPEAPTGLALTSEVGPDKDGRSILKLKATLTQPPASDLFASYVEVTAENDGNPDPLLVQPIWTNPAVVLIAKDATMGAIEGVRGKTTYWARAYATDVTGNRSDYTAAVSHETSKDNEAPGQPQDVEVAGGFKGVGIHWLPSQAADLMFFEVRYAPDDGTGTAPDVTQYETLRVRTNTVWIDGLTIGVKYWLQVRAVDFSGNVVTSASNSTAVDYLQESEAGWTGLASAIPVAVGAADVAFNSVITNILSSNQIDAATITTGILKVSVGGSGTADGIEIWNAAGTIRLGKWDENGLYIGTTAAGLPNDLSGSNYVRVTDAGLTVYLAGVATSAITPDGINATAINFGTLPGGHNLLQNSSFELADFATAPNTKTWDVAADWTGTQVSSTNVTNGANSVTATASTY